jgi:hypothetical protein
LGIKESKFQKKEDKEFLDEFNNGLENTSFFPILGTQSSIADSGKPPKKLVKMMKHSTQTSSFTNDEKLEHNLMSGFIGTDSKGDERTQNDHKQGFRGQNVPSKNNKGGSTIKPDKTSMPNKKEMLENQETGNSKPFVEELYFLNKSEIIFDEDDFGPPLEDSDI